MPPTDAPASTKGGSDMRNKWSTAVLLTAATALMTASPLASAATGGPDAFGYTFTDSNEADGPEFGLVDLETAPITVPIQSPLTDDLLGALGFADELDLADDDVSGDLDIGFDFDFYGVTHDTVRVSSNGFLVFGGGNDNGCCTGDPVPSVAGPNNIVAAFWEDLNPAAGGTILYATVDDNGQTKFVVEFRDVPHFGGGNEVTFQVHLIEGTDDIEVHYDDAPTDGGFHTAAIENEDGTDGLTYERSTVFAPADLAVRYVHP